ncbi:MAG: primosomal protein N', partial [Rhodospirillales bacterium]
MPDSRASSSYLPEEKISVLLPLPLKGPYDYRVGEGQALSDGDFVEVPLGRRMAAGVVWGPAASGIAEARVKETVRRLEAPPLPPVMIRFIEWVAAYTVYPKGQVLKMAMSVREALEPPKPAVAYRLGGAEVDIRMTPARKKVIAVLAGGPPRKARELALEAGVGVSVVKGLAKAGAIAAVEIGEADVPPSNRFRLSGQTLSESQAGAADELKARVEAGEFSVTLLDGVPGAGKTEVYFKAIDAALGQGRQVLVLLPEIALSAQWLARFRERFGAEPALWHSDLTPARRRAAWRDVAEGRARVVVGARSALFLPYPELGLIVVDEEHDASFKQEEGVIYNARDMAVVRARLGGFAIVLVSATPSLETALNAQDGRYSILNLPSRHAGASLPEIRAIDMRSQKLKSGDWISGDLRAELRRTFEAGEQAMLFLNRRGYAPLTLCRKCGHRLQCPSCTAWLVDHRRGGGGGARAGAARLECHHCGYRISPPRQCPACGGEETLAVCGPGVERLAEEAAA